ncbi:MAG: type II and III secretion system protein, partial [Verrucomicrobia bacterium]|nr:type II and III secretion system protein [Verrucomicrobiota bacterium]
SNKHGKDVGVDWKASLGEGISLSAEQSLNALFNLPDFNTKSKTSTSGSELLKNNGFQSNYSETSGNTFPRVFQSDFSSQQSSNRDRFSSDSTSFNSSYDNGPGLIFSPLDVEAIVRVLEQDDIVSQEAAPTIITEDNEQGLISIVDRFPIITSTVTETSSGTNVTQEVRYQIDEKDPDPMEDPEKSREIGVTLSVTPTLLPDGTVRMKMRPRVAKIVELIQGANGNVYPRVSESTAEAISRVPSGQSLILGGFYDYGKGDSGNKVPVLGNIPLVGRLFKYDNDTIEKMSLVFIITPSIYNASSPDEVAESNEDVRTLSGMEVSELYDLSARLAAAEESSKAAPPAPSARSRSRSQAAPAAPSAQKGVSRRGWLNRLVRPEPQDSDPYYENPE